MGLFVPQILIVQSRVIVKSTCTYSCDMECVVWNGREKSPLLLHVNSFFYWGKCKWNSGKLVVLNGWGNVQLAMQVVKQSNIVGSFSNVIIDNFCCIYNFCFCVVNKNILIGAYLSICWYPLTNFDILRFQNVLTMSYFTQLLIILVLGVERKMSRFWSQQGIDIKF